MIRFWCYFIFLSIPHKIGSWNGILLPKVHPICSALKEGFVVWGRTFDIPDLLSQTTYESRSMPRIEIFYHRVKSDPVCCTHASWCSRCWSIFWTDLLWQRNAHGVFDVEVQAWFRLNSDKEKPIKYVSIRSVHKKLPLKLSSILLTLILLCYYQTECAPCQFVSLILIPFIVMNELWFYDPPSTFYELTFYAFPRDSL